MPEGVPGVCLEVAPEPATEAAPAEVREEASGSIGGATAQEAKPTNANDSRSGSDVPEPAKEWVEAAEYWKPLMLIAQGPRARRGSLVN
jgi:hypothetical protein